jgi:hypothetical protein
MNTVQRIDEVAPRASILLMTMCVGFPLSMTTAIFVPMSDAMRDGVVAGAFVLLAVCGIGFFRSLNRQWEAYERYLTTLPMDALKASHASPEMDDRSKMIIVAFLNKRHPGWSMQRA